jgi:hypothetical protein
MRRAVIAPFAIGSQPVDANMLATSAFFFLELWHRLCYHNPVPARTRLLVN